MAHVTPLGETQLEVSTMFPWISSCVPFPNAGANLHFFTAKHHHQE
jgi:hypothetical protein